MTPSQKLRSIADSTGLDGIADAIREIANEIEHNNAPAVAIQVSDAMAIAFHNALSDGPIDMDEMGDIKTGLNAALANVQAPAPAVPQEEGRPGIPLRKAYKHLLIVAPAQEVDKSVADAEIKAMYVESQGSDKGWLGIEGSYFIGGVVAARKQKAALAQALALPTADCRPFA